MTDRLWQAKLHDSAERAPVPLRDSAGHEGNTSRVLHKRLFPQGVAEGLRSRAQGGLVGLRGGSPGVPRGNNDGCYAAAANRIIVAGTACDPTTQLHVSLVGGRKAIGFMPAMRSPSMPAPYGKTTIASKHLADGLLILVHRPFIASPAIRRLPNGNCR